MTSVIDLIVDQCRRIVNERNADRADVEALRGLVRTYDGRFPDGQPGPPLPHIDRVPKNSPKGLKRRPTRIVVTLAPFAGSFRIVKARCQCGARQARITNGGWRVTRNSVTVDRPIAKAWILRCPCMAPRTSLTD